MIPKLERQRPSQAHDAALTRPIVRPALRVPPLAGRRVDDASVALLHHERHCVVAHVERALQVHVNHRVPLVLGHLPEQLVAEDARVVHQDVELAKRVDSGANDALCRTVVGDRFVVRDGLTAVLLDRRDNLVGWRGCPA